MPATALGLRIGLVSAILGFGVLGNASSVLAEPASKRLAVLELRGPKIDEDVLSTFADALRGGAVAGLAGHDVQVMTRENMLVLLRDMGKSECSEGDCEVETARNIGADYVVSGAVVRIESLFVVTLKLHETKAASLLATDGVDAPTQIEVLRQLHAAAARLVERLKATPSMAVPAPTAPPPQPAMAPRPASLAYSERDQKIRNHDGFYLRLSVGVGFANDRLSGTDSYGTDMSGATLRGVCIPFDVAVGGTIGTNSRVVLGGMMSGTPLVSLSVSKPERYSRSDHEHMFMFVGGFATYYPNARAGTSFGAGAGIGEPVVDDPTGSSQVSGEQSSLGFAALLMAGHDFWVGDEWSMGGMIRVMYVYGPDEFEAKHSAFFPSLMLTALYH